MFDVKYYRKLSQEDIFFDELKGNVFSRKSFHNRNKNGDSNYFKNYINDLPDNDIKFKIKSIYDTMGEGGLVNLFKKLKKEMIE